MLRHVMTYDIRFSLSQESRFEILARNDPILRWRMCNGSIYLTLIRWPMPDLRQFFGVSDSGKYVVDKMKAS